MTAGPRARDTPMPVGQARKPGQAAPVAYTPGGPQSYSGVSAWPAVADSASPPSITAHRPRLAILWFMAAGLSKHRAAWVEVRRGGSYRGLRSE
jgi:hypothetical protein